jgi:putative heme-binding domain-containing protein
MRRPFLGVVVFTVVSLGLFTYVVAALSDIAGERGRVEKERAASGGAVEATPEVGEAIFWGKGTCYNCHAVGTRGSAIRGPNLGDPGPLGLPIGARAEKRAEERAKKTGKPFTATDYLMESLLEPAAYVVDGFSNIMAVPWRPPIALKADEIKAVITYLQSLGATPDTAAIEKSPFIGPLRAAAAAAASAQAAPPAKLLVTGNAEEGRKVFFDAQGNASCGKCHRVAGQGSEVGPELTTIAGMQPLDYLVESILQPSKVIVPGYEPMLLRMKDGRMVTGIIKKETADLIELADSQGKIEKVPKADVAERAPQKTSLMPGNFDEVLTVKEFHDIVAYLQTLKGEAAKEGPPSAEPPKAAAGKEETRR